MRKEEVSGELRRKLLAAVKGSQPSDEEQAEHAADVDEEDVDDENRGTVTQRVLRFLKKKGPPAPGAGTPY